MKFSAEERDLLWCLHDGRIIVSLHQRSIDQISADLPSKFGPSLLSGKSDRKLVPVEDEE